MIPKQQMNRLCGLSLAILKAVEAEAEKEDLNPREVLAAMAITSVEWAKFHNMTLKTYLELQDMVGKAAKGKLS